MSSFCSRKVKSNGIEKHANPRGARLVIYLPYQLIQRQYGRVAWKASSRIEGLAKSRSEVTRCITSHNRRPGR